MSGELFYLPSTVIRGPLRDIKILQTGGLLGPQAFQWNGFQDGFQKGLGIYVDPRTVPGLMTSRVLRDRDTVERG